MDNGMIIEWVIKAAAILLFCTGGFAYVTLYERKVLARMQVRWGPNRAGPRALLQPVADGIKLIFKEELIPTNADKIIFVVAPIITVIPALIITGVVPWGDEIVLFGRTIKAVSGGYQYSCALYHVHHFHIGLWDHPCRLVFEQQVCNFGRLTCYRTDDQL